MNQLVSTHNQQAVTNSLQVSETFEKRHDNVLRDIENLKKDVLNFEEMFFETTELDSYRRERRVYLMNRDGFTLLAMGFTGSKALQFKLKYIEAFNKMEQQLKQQFQLPTNFKEALLMLVEQVEKTEQLETKNLVLSQQVNEFKPKASYYDLVLQNKSLLTVSKIAKDYGMSAVTLNRKLHDLGVQYKQGDIWLLYAKYQDKGYTQTTTHVIDADNSKVNTKWTQKGRLFIYDLLKQEGILPMIEREEKEVI
ncbi:Rha family transcriptional regulator [Niallia circulans]|uniref:phage regulatory protein/antirepressor Ant n=1 Tax=Niallia circulans TaxID=1397 RepID=UPI00201DB887|nr:phage regulatory protein/antirepressor Ant [Niallia circulans]UQZ76823.1 Rha family transcriptional regulator [Niallia circulans]